MNGKDQLDYWEFPEETRELVGLTVVFSLVLFLALFVFFRCFFFLVGRGVVEWQSPILSVAALLEE